MWYRWS
ncbi:hypothetical protein EYF80_045158 [Liparis tanakae]|nr:hypothetical protein EYF80_045158 [Liparis tanakae]